jgi:hypothetical protein
MGYRAVDHERKDCDLMQILAVIRANASTADQPMLMGDRRRPEKHRRRDCCPRSA